MHVISDKKVNKRVVDLDRHGKIVFENYDAGRAARLQHIQKHHAHHTVEALILDSKPITAALFTTMEYAPGRTWLYADA